MTRRIAGIPCDWLDDPRLARILPWSVRRQMIRGFCTATAGNLYRYGVPRPIRRCGDDILAISDTFPRAVRSGQVQFSPAILGASANRVSFTDGTTAEVDTIIHATGFNPPTEFLPLQAQPNGQLYHGIVHPHVADLYFVGLLEAHRALLPIAEDQAAWTAAAIAGRLAVPAPNELAVAAAREAAGRRHDFGPRRRYLVDHARYRAILRREVRRAR
jgi:hypothetical protein